jgi:hypothetical protein
MDTELTPEQITEVANTTAAGLKDKYDSRLVTSYIRENAVYDRRQAQIRYDSKLNQSGRADMKKKYRAEGLATDDVDKFYEAALQMRSAGVPADKVNPLFNAINSEINSGVVAGDDSSDEEG